MNFQLKRLRLEHDMKQEDLARAISSTTRVVGSWERGETPISLEDACVLADFFSITLDELAGREWHDQLLTTDEEELVHNFRSIPKSQREPFRALASSVAEMALGKDDSGIKRRN